MMRLDEIDLEENKGKRVHTIDVVITSNTITNNTVKNISDGCNLFG